MPKLTAILDADILIYQAALQVEHEHRWDDGMWTYHAEEEHGQHALRSAIESLVVTLKADDFVLPLTDLDRNWRLDILPTYKGNRKGTRRPLLRRHLFEWCLTEYGSRAYMRPTLEGDDVAGILLTHPTLIQGDRILASLDKDMKTLPGKHYNQGNGRFFEINSEEADWWHLYQTLTGDTTDGYTGCPGVGPKKALELLNTEDPLWPVVVAAYRKAGLSEQVAIQQARVARICRHTDYDYKKRKPILWTPEQNC
ncbi:MAG: hypothetical protein LCH89_00295 [Proteobacteria bacterium]|nr:hypothetical protein [Pseudomonadota bacterium]